MDVLFVSHDTTATGAPMVLLRLLRWLHEHSQLQFGTLLQGSSKGLRSAFYELGPTWEMQPSRFRRRGSLSAPLRLLHRHRLRRQLDRDPPRLIYANTAATAMALKFLRRYPCPVITHIHELEFTLQHFVGKTHFDSVIGRTDRFLAVSQAVRQNLIENHDVDPAVIDLVPEFLTCPVDVRGRRAEVSRAVRRELGVDNASRLVSAVGTLDWRKGPDLFLQIAKLTISQSDAPVQFLWIGGDPSSLYGQQLQYDMGKAGVGQRLRLLGIRNDVADLLAASDVLLLTSREDPYPLVVLEAAAMGTPTVCFASAGGASEFVDTDSGMVAPYLDVPAAADCIQRLLADPRLCQSLGIRAAAKVRERHDSSVVCPQLLRLMENTIKLKSGKSRRSSGRA